MRRWPIHIYRIGPMCIVAIMWRCRFGVLSVGVDPGDAVAVDVEDAGDGFEGADGSVGGRQDESVWQQHLYKRTL